MPQWGEAGGAGSCLRCGISGPETREDSNAMARVPQIRFFGDPTIKYLYMQVALLGYGQALQMAKQIVASVRCAQSRGDDHPSGQSTTASLMKSVEKSARQQDNVADGDHVKR